MFNTVFNVVLKFLRDYSHRVKFFSMSTFLLSVIYDVTGNVERQTADLRKELSVVQAELANSLRRRDEAVKNEQIAIEDLKQQVHKFFIFSFLTF